MSSASATLNATPYLTWRYPVLYFQDDWQLSRRLTLNLGLRWDYESPPVERFDRQNRGFDFTARSPYQVPGFDLRGGLLFAGAGGLARGAFDADGNNWQPRFGLAYKMIESQPLVFRAGFGRYFLPTTEFGGTTGFAQTTSAQTSTPDFLPFHVLSNPFPSGLLQPPGAGRGLSTQVGDGVGFNDPRRDIPNVWQYSAGFQYEPRSSLLLEASYVGSQTKQIQVGKAQNFLTKEQLALGTPYLSTVVPNPFFGVLPANTSRGAQRTIQRRSLLTQFPHFTGVTMNNQSLGESCYNSLQLKVERRFRDGLSVLVSYTVSKTMESTAYLNSQDAELARDPVRRPDGLPRLLHPRQPEADQWPDLGPLVQHLSRHLGSATRRHPARDPAAQPQHPPPHRPAIRRHTDPRLRHPRGPPSPVQALRVQPGQYPGLRLSGHRPQLPPVRRRARHPNQPPAQRRAGLALRVLTLKTARASAGRRTWRSLDPS